MIVHKHGRLFCKASVLCLELIWQYNKHSSANRPQVGLILLSKSLIKVRNSRGGAHTEQWGTLLETSAAFKVELHKQNEWLMRDKWLTNDWLRELDVHLKP